VTEAELIDRCRADLAGYQVPKEIRFVGSLPHSAVGKLLRRNLREES
jgi:long-chain acyl-CoA synthetase